MQGELIYQAGVVGPGQVILIVLVLVLLFGAKRIPDLMKGVGRGIKEFKDATRGEDNTQKPTNDK
jgi:sec-independent protein translocase protein TatA